MKTDQDDQEPEDFGLVRCLLWAVPLVLACWAVAFLLGWRFS